MDNDESIQKLQESQLFSERRCEELNDAVVDLANQLQRVMAQVGSLEDRLGQIARLTTLSQATDLESDAPPEDDEEGF